MTPAVNQNRGTVAPHPQWICFSGHSQVPQGEGDFWLTNQMTLLQQGKRLPLANLATPALLLLRPCHFLSYIREINCKHASGIFFFYLKIVWTSLSMQHFLRELLLTLLSTQRCFISLHLFCSITKTETLLRVGWKILKQMRMMNPWKRVAYFYGTTNNSLKV